MFVILVSEKNKYKLAMLNIHREIEITIDEVINVNNQKKKIARLEYFLFTAIYNKYI